MGCYDNRGDKDEGCCNRRNDRKIPEGIEPCCHNRAGPRWMCMPYNDGWVIASIVLSIVATIFSWVYYPIFIFSLVGLTLFQLLWCCRSSRFVMYGLVSAAMLVSLESLVLGIYTATTLRTAEFCRPWDLYYYGDTTISLQGDDYWAFKDDESADLYRKDYYVYDDECWEWVLAVIPFFCSALWIASAACLFRFVHSGRHARWEKLHAKNASIKIKTMSTFPAELDDIAEAKAEAVESEAQKEPVMDLWMI